MGRIAAILRQAAELVRRLKHDTGPQRPGQYAGMSEPQASIGISGAVGRAVLVGLAVLLPALLVPAMAPDVAQILLVLALFAGAVVFMEYASAYPALVEFRFAAPFNRTRFALLSLTVLMLSLLLRAQDIAGPLPQLVAGIAAACGQMADFPFSPVRLLLNALPHGVPLDLLLLVRDGAALALVLALTTIAGFVVAIRLNVWPMGQGPFNVWINLPTFDPTAGNDVVLRLQRHARVNVSLGILMPFLLPGLVMVSALMAQPVTFASPVSFVWGIALWAFVPAALVMRGVAMARVARMIRANRRRFADTEGNAFATA
jgi:hypothetical protein